MVSLLEENDFSRIMNSSYFADTLKAWWVFWIIFVKFIDQTWLLFALSCFCYILMLD